MRRILTYVVSLGFLLAATMPAQQLGKIQGTIRDVASGKPIPRAFVTIPGTSFRAAANGEGFYTLENIPAGIISVRAGYVGYQAHEIAGLRILAGQTLIEDFTLAASPVELRQLSPVPSVLLRFQLIRPVATRTIDQAIMPIDSVLRDLFQWTGYRLLSATTMTSDLPVSVNWGGNGSPTFSQTALSVDGEDYELSVSVISFEPPQIKLSVSLAGVIPGSPTRGGASAGLQRKMLLNTTVTVNMGRTVVLGGTQPGGGRGGMAGTLILAVKPEMRSTP